MRLRLSNILHFRLLFPKRLSYHAVAAWKVAIWASLYSCCAFSILSVKRFGGGSFCLGSSHVSPSLPPSSPCCYRGAGVGADSTQRGSLLFPFTANQPVVAYQYVSPGFSPLLRSLARVDLVFGREVPR